jgi:hypothetical protein
LQPRNILFVIAAVLGVAMAGRLMWIQLQRLDAVRIRTTGMITYRCRDRWALADFDPKTVGPPVLNLIAQHHTGKTMSWSVQRPGFQQIPASVFKVNTHSYGGSLGLRWRQTNGNWMVSILSFSDIIGEYGPATIWVENSHAHDGHDGREFRVLPGAAGALICSPDPASYKRV